MEKELISNAKIKALEEETKSSSWHSALSYFFFSLGFTTM
jgi:hypothetical protein